MGGGQRGVEGAAAKGQCHGREERGRQSWRFAVFLAGCSLLWWELGRGEGRRARSKGGRGRERLGAGITSAPPPSMTPCGRLWPCVGRACGGSSCGLCLGAWLSPSRWLMVTLVCLGVYLALGSDVDHSWLLAGQCVSACGHFRPLGLDLSTRCCLFRAKPPIPLTPPGVGLPGSRGHGCRQQRGCQSKPAPVTCRKAAGGRGLGQGWGGSWGREGSGARAGAGTRTALFRS